MRKKVFSKTIVLFFFIIILFYFFFISNRVNSIVFTLASTGVLSSLIGKTFQNYFFYVFALADKIFHGIDPIGEILLNIYPDIFSS